MAHIMGMYTVRRGSLFGLRDNLQTLEENLLWFGEHKPEVHASWFSRKEIRRIWEEKLGALRLFIQMVRDVIKTEYITEAGLQEAEFLSTRIRGCPFDVVTLKRRLDDRRYRHDMEKFLVTKSAVFLAYVNMEYLREA